MPHLDITVLVADDERHIVRLLQVNLERNGFKVIAAFDGREALEKIHTEKPHLAILDVVMPYLGGIEILKQLRQEQDTKTLPIIIATGAEKRGEFIALGYEAGADLCVSKPFELTELMDSVKSLAITDPS